MDYKSLSKNLSKVTDSTKTVTRKTVLNRVSDAAAQRRAAARKQAIFDSFKQKIKDEMEATESTDEVVEVAINALNEGVEPADVIQATVEILGDVIDQIKEDDKEIEKEEKEEDEDETKLEDARRRKLVEDAKARIAARRRSQMVADAKARMEARRRAVADAKTRMVARRSVRK